MSYASWSVVFGEQPSAAKWNILGTNDAAFNNGTGFAAGALGSDNASLANGILCQIAKTETGTSATGTSSIPLDNTIPQNTEGDQYMTLAITPKATTNILVIKVEFFYSNSATTSINMALFQDSTANALCATEDRIVFASAPQKMTLEHQMVAGTTSSTTFKVRAGTASGTLNFNGSGGTQRYGGVANSGIIIREYKAT